MANILTRVFGSANDRMLRRFRTVVEEINALEATFQALPSEAFPEKTRELRAKLEGEEATLADLLPEAFAMVREASRRTIGLRHYDVQLLGGMVLHRGMIAEMKTGEGKTLVATLPLYLNALTGKGAHLVTVNDYLARRDVQWMGPIYAFLGLTVGSIIHDASFRFDQTYLPNDYRLLHLRPVDRREAYGCDITYGTNNEFGFDYLRDNMKESLDQYAQRELSYAIVDEVDNILIDEARTPLIISGQAEQSSEKYYTVNRIIPRLVRDADYTIDEKHRSVVLTEDGVGKCERLLGVSNLYDPSQIDTLHHVSQALRAHVLFKRDTDYVVKDGEVIIVDEFTGRLMPGRRWSDGLHQAVEAKEAVRIESENVTLATITIQNYFRMYAKLAGMTGTADTEAVEFQKTYKLEVAVIPSNKTPSRMDNADVVYLSEREKFDAVVQEIRDCHERGQPVLVGTTSVEKSERVSKLLKKLGVRHNVLNAINHEAEANIIAQAGRAAQVTIATNMAGRGTDILLGGNPEYLARADMENEWIREARRAGGGSEPRVDERFEDTLRTLHEGYGEEKQALRERFETELRRLEGRRAEGLKGLSDAEEKLRKASPLRAVFERYERVKEVEFDPSVRHGDGVPERYRQAQAEVDGALDERAQVAPPDLLARVARLRAQFAALQQVWETVRTQERRPTRGTSAVRVSFRAALAEVLLAALPREQQVATVREALAARGSLADDEAPWLAAFEAGRAGLAQAQPPVVEAVSEWLVADLGADAFEAAALEACGDEREMASEGLDTWRFEYEKAARDLELVILIRGEDDADRVQWAADYRRAEEDHATAEREYEACRQPYDEGLRAAERSYDEQRAVYTRQVAEIREELQKAPQAYEAKFRESLDRYQGICREERERVVGAGGLHIIGTERHEARRIDNQLRGRAGRQGDPGSSRFYLSLEDDLLRIFGADRMQGLMERLGMKEGEPIEHRMLTRAVRNAQEKVEAHNFDVRKHLLEYDDVLNKQREVIYARRRELLANPDLKSEVLEMAERLAAGLVATYADPDVAPEEWEWKTFDDAIFAQFNFHLQMPEAERAGTTPGALEELLGDRIRRAYDEREQSFTEPVTRYLERFFWLQTLDGLWREHLVAMEHLKEGIGLRGYGQKNPLQEYQKEGYELFEGLIDRMEADVVEKVMSVQVQAGAMPAAVRPKVAAAGGGEPRPAPAPPVPDAVADLERQQQRRASMKLRLSHGEPADPSPRAETVRRDADKVGRNDPCPCGSGKKYKKCHGTG